MENKYVNPVVGCNPVLEVLMRRDGHTFEEACAILENYEKKMNEIDYDYALIEKIMLDELSLEMDYVDSIIYFKRTARTINPYPNI